MGVKSTGTTSTPPDRYYRCYGISKGIRDCREHPFIRADRLEDLIWDEVEGVLQHPEVIISGIESLRTVDEGQLQKQLGQAERELRVVTTEEERLVRLCVMGKISEEQFDHQQTFIAEREKNLRSSLDEYRGQMAMAMEAWTTTAGVLQWTEAVREGLELLSPEERREVMRLLLECVTIDGEDQVRITLAIPYPEQGATRRTGKTEPSFAIPPGMAARTEPSTLNSPKAR